MGFLDDYKRQRDERQRREAGELIDHFGGPKGCLLTILFSPILVPLGLFVELLKLAYRIIASVFVLFISIIILLPIKLFLIIISFGYWNFFEDRFIDKLGDIWD